jgi:hypothetical protein
MKELNIAIDSLNKDSTPGPDGISNYMLKNTTSEFSQSLFTLFKRTLIDNKIPDAWKISEITMIPIKGNPFQWIFPPIYLFQNFKVNKKK